ncbi:MAG TPA: hypothetical protein VGR20_14360 [Acidimicrobiia bacterium]|nr:hypothetical protein [Acidimicrobiia bacterium]
MEFLRCVREQWDRVAAIAFGIAGALAVVLGWVGASQALYPAKQLPYIVSGGVGGLLLIAAMATAWLSADLRDEWRKLDRVEAELVTLNRHLAERP